ncbi:MAG: (2Fe-2S)-binding protein [Carbonactinosporaceae bacterium]
MYVCICHGVTEREVRREIAAGARSAEDIGDRCGAGTGCGSCVDRVCALLSESAPAHAMIALQTIP